MCHPSNISADPLNPRKLRESQSHGETIRGEYVVDHDGVVRLRSAIGEKGTRGRKAEARWLARRMLRELAHERALMRAQRS